MANDYDRIFKENIERLIPYLIRKLLGIEAIRWENVSTDIHLTIERKPDFLKKIYPNDGSKPYLIHIEFQTIHDVEMPYRMLEYYGFLFRKHKIPLYQVVIQLGKHTNQQAELSTHNLTFRYENIYLRDYDYKLFLNSDVPEEVLLAVLADFKGVSPKKILKSIVERLYHLQSGSKIIQKGFEQKYANQLFILSRIRNLDDETFKILETMPFHYNIEKDFLYKKGIEEGIEKEKMVFIQALLLETSFSDEKISNLVGTSVEAVKKFREKYN